MAKKSKKKDNGSALNSSISPLKINSTLVKGQALTSYYSGGDKSTGVGELNFDLMFDPLKKVLSDQINSANKGKERKCDCKEKGADGVTKTYTGRINPETGKCECDPGSISDSDSDKDKKRKEDPNIIEQQKETDCDPDTEEWDGEKCVKKKPSQSGPSGPGTTNKEGQPCDCPPLECTGDGESYDLDALTGKGAGILDANGNCTNCPTCDDARTSGGGDPQLQEGDCPPCSDGTIPKKVDGECDCPGDATTSTKQKENQTNLEKQNQEKEEDRASFDSSTGYGIPEAFVEKKSKTSEGTNPFNNAGISSTELQEQPNRFLARITGSGNLNTDCNGCGTNIIKGDDYIQYGFTNDGKAIPPPPNRKNYKKKKDYKLAYNSWRKQFEGHDNFVEKGKKLGNNANGWQTKGNFENGKDNQPFSAKMEFTKRDSRGIPTEVNLNVVFPGKGNLNSKAKNDFNNKSYNAQDFKELVIEYESYLAEAEEIIKKADKLEGREKSQYLKFNLTPAGKGGEESVRLSKISMALSLKNMGFFDNPAFKFFRNNTGSYKSSPEKYIEDSPITYRIPIKKITPFARRDRVYLNVRKKWMPNQQPQQDMMGDMGTPMGYNSPLHQEEIIEDPLQQTPVSEGGETIWDKMTMYGDGIDSQVEKFIAHNNYDPAFEKPIATIKNQEWINAIKQWLNVKKQQIIEAGKNKDNSLEQELTGHVNTLIADITSYAGKFVEWLDRNAGDQTPGAIGGSLTSDGSKKDEKFIANLAFMGDTNTDFAIDNSGKIGIQSYGLNDIRRVEDLDTDVFARDDSGLATFLDILGTMQDDAQANKPLNDNIIKGQADLLIKQQDSLLSWAHDPLYGQAWIQDFSQANPNEDISWAMPESDVFDKERLEDEVHGWLVDKLAQAYHNRRPKNEKSVDQIHKETIASLDQSESSSPENIPSQLPPIQREQKGSPMVYKSRAQQLIAKYS